MGRHHKRKVGRIVDLRAGYLEMACRVLLRSARPAVDARRAREGREVAMRLMAQAGVDVSRLEAPLPVEMEAGDLAAYALGTVADEVPMDRSVDLFATQPLCMGHLGSRWDVHCGICGEWILTFTSEAVDTTPERIAASTKVARKAREDHLRMCHGIAC